MIQLFDSLTHVTRDSSWMGERSFDASLPRLLSDMSQANATRACLVTIADHGDNDYTLECARPNLMLDFSDMLKRFDTLSQGIEPHRIENITHRNLDRLFASCDSRRLRATAT